MKRIRNTRITSDKLPATFFCSLKKRAKRERKKLMWKPIWKNHILEKKHENNYYN